MVGRNQANMIPRSLFMIVLISICATEAVAHNNKSGEREVPYVDLTGAKISVGDALERDKQKRYEALPENEGRNEEICQRCPWKLIQVDDCTTQSTNFKDSFNERNLSLRFVFQLSSCI